MTPTREILKIIRRDLIRYRDAAEKSQKTTEGWKGDHAAEASYWRGKAMGLVTAISVVNEMIDAVEITEEKELDEMATAYAEENERSEKDCMWEGRE